MQRIKLLVFAGVMSVLTVTAPLTSQAVAAPASSQPPPVTNTEDFYYDFEVYMAPEEISYSVTYYLKSGTGGHAKFDTLAEAEAFESGLWSTDQVISTEITFYQGPAWPWEYVTIFDKRADAEQFADAIEGMGFYAKVERVYGLPILSRPSR